MHHVMGSVGLKRMAGSATGEIACGVALPVLPLSARLANLRAAVTLMDRAERRAGLDGLQLLRIADQHDLGPGLGGMGQHAFQLPGAMPASSITRTSRAVSPSRPCCQPCSRLAIVRDAMPDPLSRFSAAMPDNATPRTS